MPVSKCFKCLTSLHASTPSHPAPSPLRPFTPRPHGTSGSQLLLPHQRSWSSGDQNSASPEHCTHWNILEPCSLRSLALSMFQSFQSFQSFQASCVMSSHAHIPRYCTGCPQRKLRPSAVKGPAPQAAVDRSPASHRHALLKCSSHRRISSSGCLFCMSLRTSVGKNIEEK